MPVLEPQFRHDYIVWRTMDRAPKDCTHVHLLMDGGVTVKDAHWAEDLSGEEQPPFRGWFVAVKDGTGKFLYNREVPGEPCAWAPVSK